MMEYVPLPKDDTSTVEIKDYWVVALPDGTMTWEFEWWDDAYQAFCNEVANAARFNASPLSVQLLKIQRGIITTDYYSTVRVVRQGPDYVEH